MRQHGCQDGEHSQHRNRINQNQFDSGCHLFIDYPSLLRIRMPSLQQIFRPKFIFIEHCPAAVLRLAIGVSDEPYGTSLTGRTRIISWAFAKN